MSEHLLIDQLEQALERLLTAGEREHLEALNPALAALLDVARELRHLPRSAFRNRLKADLERSRTTMHVEDHTTTSRPAGFRAVTPYMIVQDAPALIDFVTRTFGGEERHRAIGSAGGLHAEVRIGNSMVMIGGGAPDLQWRGTSMPTALHVYVEDVDAAFRRALSAGATPIYKPMDHDYGERSGGVRDPGGNHWYIATATGPHHVPAGLHTVNICLHPVRGEAVIAFLERAFGARTLEKVASSEGAIQHAKVAIEDSVLEIGDAHGPFQPMPTMFYVFVADVDAAYERALAAGATTISAPADQPYGNRTAGVQDAFGNQWYVAAPVRRN